MHAQARGVYVWLFPPPGPVHYGREMVILLLSILVGRALSFDAPTASLDMGATGAQAMTEMDDVNPRSTVCAG
jgi:hypothetical protein